MLSNRIFQEEWRCGVSEALSRIAYRLFGKGPDAIFLSAAVWNHDLAGLATMLEGFASNPDVKLLTSTGLLVCVATP